MDREEFEQFSVELLASVEQQPGVIGLVLMGSTADLSRHDEWSDHDFAVVTEPGAQDALTADLAWLPHFDRLVLTAVDPEEGFKAYYDDGHVLEFDIASIEELLGWESDNYEVVLDRGGVAEAMRTIAVKKKPGERADADPTSGSSSRSCLSGSAAPVGARSSWPGPPCAAPPSAASSTSGAAAFRASDRHRSTASSRGDGSNSLTRRPV